MKLPIAFGLGYGEIVVLLLLVVLLFGSKKLPELARALGKSLGEFKKAQREIEKELTSIEDKKPDDETLDDKKE